MRAAGIIARIGSVAVACAVATLWFGWIMVPLIGLAYGFLERGISARGSIAGLGAALAWIAILGEEAARGADVRAVADEVGALIRMPAAAFFVLTLAFASVLCAAAAVIGASLRRSHAAR